MELEKCLARAVGRERWAGRVAVIAFAVSLILMFVGGSGVWGSFDPWSPDATTLSVTLGTLYVLALVACPLALAATFSRFRPRARQAREALLEQSIAELKHDIQELRRQVESSASAD
jgi:cytochrome c biogenesis factor